MSSFLTQLFSTMMRPLQWWVVIAPWEAAIRVRAGKRIIVLSPGIHFRVPFLDRIFAQSTRLRTVTETGTTVTTLDRQTAVLSIGIEYRIADIRKVYDNLASPEMTILARSAQTITAVVARHNASDLLGQVIEESIQDNSPWESWGLADVRVMVLGLSLAKPYRLLMNDYRTHGGLSDIEGANHGAR